MKREVIRNLENGAKKFDNETLVDMMRYYRDCMTIVESYMTDEDEFETLGRVYNAYATMIRCIKKELIERIERF